MLICCLNEKNETNWIVFHWILWTENFRSFTGKPFWISLVEQSTLETAFEKLKLAALADRPLHLMQTALYFFIRHNFDLKMFWIQTLCLLIEYFRKNPLQLTLSHDTGFKCKRIFKGLSRHDHNLVDLLLNHWIWLKIISFKKPVLRMKHFIEKLVNVNQEVSATPYLTLDSNYVSNQLPYYLPSYCCHWIE